MKQALIIGAAGQDGYYLTRLLAHKGYAVYGADRFISTICPEQMQMMSGMLEVELPQTGVLEKYIREIKPNEIYYLAAHHFSSQGQENLAGMVSPFLTVNLITPNEVLQVLKCDLPTCRFFYAASAHIFGLPDVCPQTELTPHRPSTPYSISKSAGLLLCRYYREIHKIHAVTGILYNHESPRRPSSFVTTQIARAAAIALLRKGERLILRDLNAVVDWGAAEDYVEAMWLTLQQSAGDEYIISTGKPRSVMDFAIEAFSAVGLNAEEHVFQEKNLQPFSYVPYIGDNSKIRNVCGWKPTKTFASLVREMVKFQLEQLK